MAAISFAAFTNGRRFVRSQTAQATTGQTDWLAIPGWAKFLYVDYNLTAVAGTSPLVDVTFKIPDLTTLDDTTGVVNLAGHTALTQITGAARLVCQIGPGVTGIADDVTNAATGLSNISINHVLPDAIGIKILQDRTTGDETYTYTLTATFKA